MLNVLRLLLVAAVALLVICTGQRYTTGEGYVTCDGLPVPFVKVQLKDKGLIFHDKMAESRTDGKGKFRLTGKGKYIFNGTICESRIPVFWLIWRNGCCKCGQN